ncbi:uncharacterized protein PG986_001847 [Apiospora aurea]|uniref:Uncharacterized protein n=1 Tax=Apiospora aurea TaxID=335848 RepID=A0ABR1QXZ7_9PEZI
MDTMASGPDLLCSFGLYITIPDEFISSMTFGFTMCPARACRLSNITSTRPPLSGSQPTKGPIDNDVERILAARIG